MTEQEVLDGRRAFPMAQSIFAGATAERVPGLVGVGWYGTSLHPETGSFAIVKRGGPYDPLLIGEVIRVAARGRAVYAYVLGSADLPTDVALARRPFLALGLLALESLDCVIEVVQ